MGWPGRNRLMVGKLKDGQQAGVVVGPGTEPRCGWRLCDCFDDFGAFEECRAVG